MANNREYISDVFSMLMEEPVYALNVYNGVNGTDYQDPSMVEICVLEKGISLSIRNDASFILASDLNMYEHQSTYNPNMAIRQLFYLVDVLRDIIKKTKQDIYGYKRVQIPTPKFAVFYTGKGNCPEKEIFKLSDLFENKEGKSEIELECICYNIVNGNNRELLKQSPVLYDYVEFIEKVREYKENKKDNCLSEAIDWCIKNDILKDFLTRRKDEVMKAMVLDMTFETREEYIRRDALEEGIEQGIEKLIKSCKELTGSKDIAVQQLMKQYELDEDTANVYVSKYWE